MLISNHDNQKFSVSGNSVFVINNNSNVYIDQNINTDIIITTNKKTISNTLATVTFNKGNTINNLSQTLISTHDDDEYSTNFIPDYDIVYSNSVLFAKQKSWTESQQEFLTEYNFPAAKYKINGYKNNYAILLNNGINPQWTDIEKGVLIGDITVNSIKQLPTRLNGYTATITNLTDSYIDKKYNGIIKAENFSTTLSANFVYDLQLKRYISPSSPKPFNFSNITYLSIESDINTNVTIKNVRYSKLNTRERITIQNSNIAISNLNQIDPNSYNTTVSYNVTSNEYKNYLLSGILVNANFGYRNILVNKLKLQKQLSHPINETEGYNSNVPIGSIVWYPQAWSSFDPANDKNSSNPDKSILLRGEPTTTDWELCDGHAIDSTTLYSMLYGLNTTPNYKVRETSYRGFSNINTYHFLTEPSVIQFLPSTIFNFYIASANGTIRQTGGNQHNRSQLTVTQNLQDGSISMGIGISQWQAHSYVNCIFSVNVEQLRDANIDLENEFAIQFDSPGCAGGGPNGDAWWYAWTGGSINALSSKGYLPTSDENGDTWTTNSAAENHQLYIGGWPAENVTGYCKGTQAWIDTLNVPKIAMILSSTDGSDYFNLQCVNGKVSGLRLFADTVHTLGQQRVGYVDCSTRNISFTTGHKNSRKIRQCCDIIHANNLPYLWKTWRIKFKTNNIPETALNNGILTGMLRLQITIPTIYARLRSRSNDVIYRWAGTENRDGDDSQRLYKMYYSVKSVTVFKNLKCRYITEVIPAKISKTNNTNTTSISQTWNWGTHHIGYNSVDWPQRLKAAKADFKTNGTFYNYGLFRRLNPYIKVNDNNITNNIAIDEEDDFNKTSIIRIRHNFNSALLQNLHLNTISNDTLSACYIADDWNALKENVQNFYYKIDNQNLESMENNKTTAYLQFLTENDPINAVSNNRKVCDIYKDENENVTYIKCGENSEDFKKIFPVYYTTDEDGNIFETYNYLNDQTYELQQYKNKTTASEATNRPIINYTIYSVSYSQINNTYSLRINNDLLKLSNCNRMLQNTVNYIDNYLTTLSGTGTNIKEYYNTCSSHLPVFWRDNVDELNNNNSENIDTYYYLGTGNQVMSAVDKVSSYVFKYTHDVQTDPENPEVVTYNSLTALVHSYKNKMNIIGNYYKRTSVLEAAGGAEVLSTNVPLKFESSPVAIQVLRKEVEDEDIANNYMTLQYKKNADSQYTGCNINEEIELVYGDAVTISGIATGNNVIKLLGNENSNAITLTSSKNGAAATNYTFGTEINLTAGQTIVFNGTVTRSNKIQLKAVGTPDPITILYKKNNDNWTNYTINDEIELIGKETISFSGNNTTFSKDSNNYYQFTMIGAMTADGSIQSLVNDSDSCTNYCYINLFADCTNLLIAPALPASTLAPSCYYNMFKGCTSLTDAPLLPATTLADSCYANMFSGCTNLNSMNVKFVGWTPTNATTNWLKNVAAAGDFKKPDDLTNTTGVSNIPTNWTSINNTPIENPLLSNVSSILVPGETYTLQVKLTNTESLPSSTVNTQIYNAIKKCTQHLKNNLNDVSNYTGFDSVNATQYENYFSNFTNNPYTTTTYNIPTNQLVKLDVD